MPGWVAQAGAPFRNPGTRRVGLDRVMVTMVFGAEASWFEGRGMGDSARPLTCPGVGQQQAALAGGGRAYQRSSTSGTGQSTQHREGNQGDKPEPQLSGICSSRPPHSDVMDCVRHQRQK